MSTKIWTDVNLLTMDDNDIPYGLIKKAAIVQKSGVIAWIGEISEIPDTQNG